MATNSVPELVLYSRTGCHLCEDMISLLDEFVGDLPTISCPTDYTYTLRVVDIDKDANLRDRFNVLVPALYLGEKEICHHFLDVKSLAQALDDFHNPAPTNS